MTQKSSKWHTHILPSPYEAEQQASGMNSKGEGGGGGGGSSHRFRTCSDTRSRRRVGGGTKQIRQANCYNSWSEWSFFSGGQVFHPDNPKVSKYLKVD